MRRILKILFSYFPVSLKEKLRKIKLREKVHKSREIKKRFFISSNEMETLLNEMGLDSDFIIHGAIGSIGKFEGGPKGVTAQFVEYALGRGLTILTPALPFNIQMREYLEETDVFDIVTAPNKMGSLSQVLMQWPGSIRTAHPTHSCIVLGRKANEYSAVDFNGDTFGPTSPFYRLVKNNGAIVLFGVSLDSVTNMHVVEDMLGESFPVNVYCPDKFSVTMLRAGKKIGVASICCHDPKLSSIRYCEQIRGDLERNKILRSFSFGSGKVEVLQARGLARTQLEILLDGRSIYGKVNLSADQRACVIENLNNLSKLGD